MDAYIANIKKETLSNKYYRNAVYTDGNIQMVLMSISAGDQIGGEKHKATTQFFRIEKGRGVAVIGDYAYSIKDDSVFIVPPNTYHNVVNTSMTSPLKLYTIYSPPEHPPGTIEKLNPRNL